MLVALSLLLSNFAMSGGEELQLASSQQQYDQSWALNTSLLPIGDGCDMSGSNACPVASDQDKMKAEKQGSHGMNGIQEQETFDMGNDLCDSLWDLPPICQLSTSRLFRMTPLVLLPLLYPLSMSLWTY